MAITETFLWSTQSDLSVEAGANIDLEHKTDESDNPQDTVRYLGSLSPTARKLQQSDDPGVNNITISVVNVLPHWEQNKAYSVGDRVQPTSGNENGFVYQCTVAGISHASTEPTWPTGAIGDTVIDNTAVFKLWSAKHEETEVTLATSSGDLATNTPGASLSLGNTINSGVGNAVAVWIRVNNAVNTVYNNVTVPDLQLQINNVTEYEG